MQRHTQFIVKQMSWVCLACSVILTSPMGIWPLELLQALALQMAVFGILLLILGIATQQWLSAMISLMAVVLVWWFIHPYQPEVRSAKVVEGDLIVGVFNVYHHNQTYTEGIAAMLDQDCDVVAVQEVSSGWDVALANAFEHVYPYSVRMPQNTCCYGMSLYSKLPIVVDTVLYFTRDPIIKALVALDGKNIEVWIVHTRPPVFPNNTEERNFVLAKVASEIAASGTAALLLGDLNIVPWAKEFKQLKEVSGLDDSRRGFLATYPTELGFPLIPIDHILHSEAFSTVFCKAVPIPGSDHRGLVAGLNWR